MRTGAKQGLPTVRLQSGEEDGGPCQQGLAVVAAVDASRVDAMEEEPPVICPLSPRKPIVCAVNGACVGVGLVHASCCNMRFAASGAKLATAFARRSLIAEYGVVWLVPRLIGVARVRSDRSERVDVRARAGDQLFPSFDGDQEAADLRRSGARPRGGRGEFPGKAAAAVSALACRAGRCLPVPGPSASVMRAPADSGRRQKGTDIRTRTPVSLRPCLLVRRTPSRLTRRGIASSRRCCRLSSPPVRISRLRSSKRIRL